MSDPFERYLSEACDHGEALELMDALVASEDDADDIAELEREEIDRLIRDKWARESLFAVEVI